MPRHAAIDLSIDGPVPLADELVALFPREERRTGDVDCEQMARLWRVAPRTALTRLHALSRSGQLTELKVINPDTLHPITVWRKP